MLVCDRAYVDVIAKHSASWCVLQCLCQIWATVTRNWPMSPVCPAPPGRSTALLCCVPGAHTRAMCPWAEHPFWAGWACLAWNGSSVRRKPVRREVCKTSSWFKEPVILYSFSYSDSDLDSYSWLHSCCPIGLSHR